MKATILWLFYLMRGMVFMVPTPSFVRDLNSKLTGFLVLLANGFIHFSLTLQYAVHFFRP